MGGAQRLKFIEFRLFWEGRVNRSDLMEQFELSVNQASADLNRYIGFAPDNMVYDKSARTYVRGPDYAARFLQPDASRYLAQLRSLADGTMDSDDTWIAELPSYDAAPTPARGVNPMTLRSVVGAIRRSEAIEVKYQSLSRPEPSWRWIAPHAIGFDSFRWHMRAFCLTDEAFKDFLLSRMLEIRGSQESSVTAEVDLDWNTQVTLEIGAHPALSETQAKVIALVDRDALVDELIRRSSRTVGQNATLSSGENHIPWLGAERKKGWIYWKRYSEYMETRIPWTARDALDVATDEVLSQLENPTREGAWDRRGLVVGHVQSGKTGNYTGLICKAADAGYKIIIVLAGLHNNLRA